MDMLRFVLPVCLLLVLLRLSCGVGWRSGGRTVRFLKATREEETNPQTRTFFFLLKRARASREWNGNFNL